jgi:RNA polymerase sigma factor (sigma-70 family)
MENSQTSDQALQDYLSAQGESEQEELGELLTSCAEPVIRKVVFSRIKESQADAEDVCADALLNLMLYLQHYRETPDQNPIRDFSNYAATTAHHACDQYLRRKNPERWRLRNQIRYLLENDPKLAVWRNSEGVVLCGFAIWQSQEKTEPSAAHDSASTEKSLPLREFLFRTFHSSNSPLDLNGVVESARSTLGLPDRREEDSGIIENLPDERSSIGDQFEQRTYATELWNEIQQLPLRQRHALLLNLKDDAMNLLLFTGVASLRQIAGTLEMEAEQLASIWNKLPLEDTEIAAKLACTRQQVINLRMAARKRLANRMAGWS